MTGSPDSNGENDVLFIRLRLLGDIVFTIPAVQIFKNRFPSVRLHYVVEERFREMAGLIPGVDHVISVPRRRGLKDILSFRRRIRELGMRTVVDFHSGPGSALLALASGADRRVGYRTPNRNWDYNRLVDRQARFGPEHSVSSQCRLLEGIGIAAAPPPYPPIDARSFPPSPRLAPLLGIRPKVVVHLGAGNRFRDWGMDHFSELVRRLSSMKTEVFLVGGSAEERGRAARLSATPHTRDLSGPMTIRELLALVSSAAVYVGADSGPLHVASLTATPLVALFGPNRTEVSGPWRRDKVEIMELDMACRPCSQRGCKYGTIPCMRDIGVDKVHEAVSKFIQ